MGHDNFDILVVFVSILITLTVIREVPTFASVLNKDETGYNGRYGDFFVGVHILQSSVI